MNRKNTALGIALAALIAIPAGYSVAQQGAPAAKSDAQPEAQPGTDTRAEQSDRRGRGKRERAQMSPQMMERMLDGRLAGAKAALRLTREQEALWPAVEKAVRDTAADRMKRRDEMRASRQGGERPDLLQRLDIMSERSAARATQTKQLADALRPLYGTLSDEQKQVVGAIMPGRGGGQGRRGREMRHGNYEGDRGHHRGHHGMGRHGGGHGGWQRG